MRISLVSDVHTEFMQDGGVAFSKALDLEGVDVLVVAGDLGTETTLRTALTALTDVAPNVVTVSGNHELYRSSFKKIRDLRFEMSAKLPNLHWLDRSETIINGQRFLGCSLWFSYQEGNESFEANMSDFSLIENFRNEVYRENAEDVAFLTSKMCEDDIVVTHYLPSYKSVDPKWARSALNRFFVCEIDGLLEEAQPKAHLHGHTHESCNYKIGNTRVLCNPFGYLNHDLNPRFKNVVFDV